VASKQVRDQRQIGFGWADVIGPAATATVVFTVFLWLRNQGLDSLTTLDTGLAQPPPPGRALGWASRWSSNKSPCTAAV